MFVAVVFALGAWNWRRQRPRLGTDAAELFHPAVRHLELAAAAVVLAVHRHRW